MLKELEAIEKEHPDWVIASSPTQRVGEALTKGFRQVEHEVPMLSLANTYSEEELADFIKRVHKLLGHTRVNFCAELKMDGVAVSVRYEKGKYVRALTRGDGRKGDDITANMKTILSVPLELHGSHVPEILEVRAEVFMTHKVFQKLNREREENGLEVWANPRNAAAGALKLLDPKEVASRKLSAVFYGIAQASGRDIPTTQTEVHFYLQKLGFPIFDKEDRARCENLKEILAFAEKINRRRAKMPFDIDGIVIKVDELRFHDVLGATGKSPRSAVAYKFAPEQALTQINDIIVQVGRTGVLTPVAELKPVKLAGSTISRATLHNQDEVMRKDIRIHDWVTIEKGGDVIPKVVQVELKKRPHGTRPWKMPSRCPSCHAHVVHRAGEVAVRCPNKECPEQNLRRIIFFASKGAMDIGHLGEKIIEQLVEKGFVHKISDLYTLTEKEVSQLEGFKEKSVQNLLESIDASRKVSLARFILALGIKYIGERTAEILAEAAGNVDTLVKMSEEELLEIEGVGEKTAKAIVDYFTEPSHLKEIRALIKAGVHPQAPKKIQVKKGHEFFGKTFVLTGTLSNYTRDQAMTLIKERGGKIASSVSKKTDYVLVGEDPGSKLNKAKELKIKTLDEDQFEKLL
jgi:DNA ligase (NAD+)